MRDCKENNKWLFADALHLTDLGYKVVSEKNQLFNKIIKLSNDYNNFINNEKFQFISILNANKTKNLFIM